MSNFRKQTLLTGSAAKSLANLVMQKFQINTRNLHAVFEEEGELLLLSADAIVNLSFEQLLYQTNAFKKNLTKGNAMPQDRTKMQKDMRDMTEPTNTKQNLFHLEFTPDRLTEIRLWKSFILSKFLSIISSPVEVMQCQSLRGSSGLDGDSDLRVAMDGHTEKVRAKNVH